MSAEPTRRLPPTAAAAVRLAAPAGVAAAPDEPPRARPIPRFDRRHNDIRLDEFHWLRERDSAEVLAYLEAENAYTARAMQSTEPLQEALYRELLGRIQETDLTVPEPLDQFLYYSRTEAGRQYPIFCRRQDAEGAGEEILLDLNAVAADEPYCRLGAREVSPDHRYLAYSVDLTGAEQFELRILDLTTGALLPERIGNTSRGVAWANDGRTLFYAVLDSARRPYAVCRHRIGTTADEDALVYVERNDAFFVDVARTRSRAFVLLEIASHTTSEVRYLPADRPTDTPRVLVPRRHGVEYSVAHHGDRFFIASNHGAENFRLVEAPVRNPGPARWRELLPHRPDVKIDGLDAFRDHLVVYEREGGLPQIRVIDLDSGQHHRVAFPEPVYTVRRSENPAFDTRLLRFVYTSLVTPAMVVDYDMASRTWAVRKQTEVRGYDPALYRSERLEATAPDGIRVPVSLVYRSPLVPDGRRPALLLGYGAYGVSFEPGFSHHYLSLLDRGFVVAIAHVRGGEEMGRRWYENGKLLHKRNSFTDFIAAAEHLIAAGYTAPDRLAINGGSAGGLLMGAVINLRPDLFKAVVAEVPFLDVVNTMLDPSLPLTVIEYEEWGNPNDPEAYAYIRSYSPYDNIEAKAYPHMLVTGGLNDPRVAYWEPAKWTARLRARKTDGNRLLLKTNMGAGHAGASGRYDFLREVALKYAFVLDALGMNTEEQRSG
ncbi:MAG TPA: S9 family peptidase [Gemmatimonadales bacterium]|nr:S9 family peptidase [Gemmatimonadales bacterium]